MLGLFCSKHMEEDYYYVSPPVQITEDIINNTLFQYNKVNQLLIKEQLR